MARAKKRTPQVEEVRPYVEGVAKNLIDKLYKPDGPAWGTRLNELEDLFVSTREVLSEKLLADALARQAAAQADPGAYLSGVSTAPGLRGHQRAPGGDGSRRRRPRR